MTDLFRAAPHIRLQRGKTMVLKVGGSVLSRPSMRRQIARQIAVVHALGARVVVVHGGGPQTDELQRNFGDEPRLVDGRRVTSAEALRALVMATAGEVNTQLTASLLAEDTPAVGVCAASGPIVVAKRRPPVVTSEGEVDFGHVGDVHDVAPQPLESLLDAGHVPVVAPPASDGAGGLLNVNADLAAAALASAMGAAKLVLMTRAPGILESVGDESSLVSVLTLPDVERMLEAGQLEKGMHVKATAIGNALRGGVGRVHVVSGTEPDALLRELYTSHGAGTLVTLEPERAPESGGDVPMPGPIPGSAAGSAGVHA